MLLTQESTTIESSCSRLGTMMGTLLLLLWRGASVDIPIGQPHLGREEAQPRTGYTVFLFFIFLMERAKRLENAYHDGQHGRLSLDESIAESEVELG